jgi:hypothetical protein
MNDGTAKEKYSFGEIAADLGVSHSTVRDRFRREPGVLRVGVPGSKRPRYVVPASVYERVKLSMSPPPAYTSSLTASCV